MEKNVEKQLVVRTVEPDMNALKQTADVYKRQFEAGGDQQRMYFSLSAASVEESTVRGWQAVSKRQATTTTAEGSMPDRRHLMSRNFSAPRSAPKPASVTT